MLVKRLGAIAAVLTLCAGNVAVCAGWQVTPEARMACCMSGTSCPMHKSESQRSGSTRVVTQVQADNCCAAASNRTPSSVPDSAFALTQPTMLPAMAIPIVELPVLALQEWRAVVPLRVSSVPKHLLLSVLLV